MPWRRAIPEHQSSFIFWGNRVVGQQKTQQGKEKPQPQMLVLSDNYADLDQIGYADHAAGLVEMVAAVQPDKGSFTVGVFGEWGAGKTSLLR